MIIVTIQAFGPDDGDGGSDVSRYIENGSQNRRRKTRDADQVAASLQCHLSFASTLPASKF